jgi:intracellular septation protein
VKLLFDFFPVILFFAAYKLASDPADPQHGILVATAVAIVATAVQVGWTWWRQRRVERMHVITLALIVVLGGATLLLRDEIFIKWKPTAVNWLFALVFLASQYVGRAPIVRRLMEHAITVPDPVWARLNLSWVAFFLVLGLANLYVVYNFDTDAWVNFKLFGMLGLTVLFVLGQGLYLSRHMPDAEGEGERAGKP